MADDHVGNGFATPDPKPWRFKPGVSGNPKGRPKGRSITDRLRELVEQNEINGKPIAGDKQVADLLAETMLKKAIQGDFRYFSMVVDRLYGKVPDRIAGPDGEPLGGDLAALRSAIMTALEGFPEARFRVARALYDVGKVASDNGQHDAAGDGD